MRRPLAVGGSVWAAALALAACGAASAQAAPALAGDVVVLPPTEYTWTTECRLEDGSRGALLPAIRTNPNNKRTWQGDEPHAVFGTATLRVVQDGREVAAGDGKFVIAPAGTFDRESGQVRRAPGEWFVSLTRDDAAVLRGTARFADGGRMLLRPDAESKVQVAARGGSIEWAQVPGSFNLTR